MINNKEKELFEKAMKGDGSILDHPSVDKVKDNFGWTPLHLLAYDETKGTKIKIVQKYGWNKLCKILKKPKKQLMWELLK